MRNLLDFLIKHHAWISFIVYVAIACILLFYSNPYQQSIYFGSANEVSAKVYETTDKITGYFGLREANRVLSQRNGELEMEVLQLRRRLQKYSYELAMDTLTAADSVLCPYSFVVAQVINNSVSRLNNYITLDKGTADGVCPEMGVVGLNGVVGIVTVANEHNAVAISVLNPKLRLSCKVKGTDCFGSLVWDGRDSRYAVLEEMPRHVEFEPGDTIVTSGYSAVFPEGIMVGTIYAYSKQKDDNFYAMQVALSTDFSRLGVVRVIHNAEQAGRRQLEKEASR